MDPPLIDERWRRPAVLAIGAGALVFLVLGAIVFHGSKTALDSWWFREVIAHVSTSHGQFLLGFTEPAVSVVLLGCVVVLAAAARRWDLAVLAVFAPSIGTLLSSVVLKPLIHRTMFGGAIGTYPSGHETGVVCTATVLVIAFGQLPLGRVSRVVLTTLLALWTVIAAMGLTRFYYHYATDTIGAAGISIALVLAFALAIDRVGGLVLRRARTVQPQG